MRSSTPEPTMASTPTEPVTPPPGRVHTPSAPRFGPILDSWEPYTPRRSARLAAKSTLSLSGFPTRTKAGLNLVQRPSPGPAVAGSGSKLARFNARHSGDKSEVADPFCDANSGAGSLSPAPPSPISHSHPGLAPHPASPDADPFLSSWPTPSKTPSKPKNLSVDLDGPPPRLDFSTPSAPRFEHLLVSKRPPKLDPRLLESRSLTKDLGSSKRRGKFEVYVDSSLRVPVLDEAEENPFISRPAKSTSAAVERAANKALDEPSDPKIKEAVERNEGAVYVFRGKRLFRAFSPPVDDDPFTTDSNATDAASTFDLSDDLGGPRKPVARLLWPEATKQSAPQQESPPHKTKPTPLTLKSTKPTPKPRMMSPIPMPTLITGLSPSRPDDEAASLDRSRLFSTPSKGRIGSHLTPLTNILTRSIRTPISHSKRPLDSPVTTSMASEIFSPRMLTITSPIVSENQLKPKSPFDSWRRTKSPTKLGPATSDKIDKLSAAIEPVPRPQLKRGADELGNARKRIRGGG